ncbi:MAG: hypothetical protein NT154_37815, partial [Verrucomicrobia bacterium]|nr:hypothetical protein [Verrucomicrobiota bacterium]
PWRKTCTANTTGGRVHEASCSEEPGAGKLHAGICEGGAGQPASLPRQKDRSKYDAPYDVLFSVEEKP